jgi:tRNA/rRNA methyltransferase
LILTSRKTSSLHLNRFRVVLVEPKIPENIGSVARLLENYSVGSAALVNPKCEFRTGRAPYLATGPSLQRLMEFPVVSSLPEAVQGCEAVVGFTARSGRARKLSIQLEEIGEKLGGNVALVFGREDFCLLKEETEHCTHLCALDTSPHFPALNLSHSVAVVLSQLFLQDHDSRKGHFRRATTDEIAPMFDHLREMMLRVGLTKAGNPERMLSRLRKIFQRSELTPQDIALLRGLYAKVIATVDYLSKK